MRIIFKYRSYMVVGLSLTFFLFCTSFSLWRYRRWERMNEPPETVRKVPIRNFSIAELMGSTNVKEVVQPNVPTLLLQPSAPHLKESNRQKRPFAVIVVVSQARFFNQRYSIRSTWYKWAEELDIRIFFMIGFHTLEKKEVYKILKNEQKLYDDLIIDNYEEGYYKLPGKILRMLKWYNSTYSDQNAPRFLIKTDQDVFINLPNLVKALKRTSYYQNLASFSDCRNEENSSTCVIPDEVNLPFYASDPETYYIGGRRFENPRVDSNPDSKWFIDSYERERMSWSGDVFPTYTNGPCYVISGNLVKSIYEASFRVPIYPFEDVYIVGMIAYDRMNLYISNIDHMWLDKSELCNLKKKSKIKKMVAVHPVDHPLFMIKVCKRVRSCQAHLSVPSSAEAVIAVSSCSYLSANVILVCFVKYLTLK